MTTNHTPKAVTFAFKAHDGQVRKYGGGPYIQHPVRVALRVACFGDVVAAAAVLHDVVEDCDVRIEQILIEFGLEVGSLVAELTDVYTKKQFAHLNRAQRKEREHKRLQNASCEARIIKLADLLDNLSSIDPTDGFAPVFCDEAEHLLGLIQHADMYLSNDVALEIRRLRKQFKPRTEAAPTEGVAAPGERSDEPRIEPATTCKHGRRFHCEACKND